MDPALLGPSPRLLPKHYEVVPLSAKELGCSSTHWFHWPQSFTITMGSVPLDEVLASTLVLLNDLTHFLVFWAPPKVTSDSLSPAPDVDSGRHRGAAVHAGVPSLQPPTLPLTCS